MFTQACRRTDIIVDGKGFSGNLIKLTGIHPDLKPKLYLVNNILPSVISLDPHIDTSLKQCTIVPYTNYLSLPEKEKKKAKNTRVKGTQRQGPSALPFFGNTSDQMPTAFTQEPAQGLSTNISNIEIVINLDS